MQSEIDFAFSSHKKSKYQIKSTAYTYKSQARRC